MKENVLCHIVLLGQSLSMGYATESCLPEVNNLKAFMFKQVRTQDLGYVFGITKENYSANSAKYENDFYSRLQQLKESGGNGMRSTQWESASWNEYETPASGIIQGLTNAYTGAGQSGLPYDVLISAPGIGGTAISAYSVGSKIYERAKKDIENGKRLAAEKGQKYKVLAVVWMQGEENYGSSASDYYGQLLNIKNQYNDLIKEITGQAESATFVSYQAMGQKSYYSTVTQNPALAQFDAANREDGFYLTAPCYQFATYSDKIHLTNVSSRNIGILLGDCIYKALNGDYSLFKPEVSVNGKAAVLQFPFDIKLDAGGAIGSYDNSVISSNGGFFCYDSEENLMRPTLKLDADNRTLRLNCGSNISKITYGYDASANSTAQYTYGGAVRTMREIRGYNTNIGCYMPVQNIY